MNKYLIDPKKSEEIFTSYKPILFRLDLEKDKLGIENLLRDNSRVVIFNEIYSQLKDLIKLMNPTQKLSEADYDNLITEHLKDVKIEDYGVWAYYPWSYRLVHILDEKEFIQVRTNRNTYKITPEERDVLAGKRVGVVGLSVGQSVAVTMAMERCCGEIRIADFDTLELTNLNRIRTGVHNLGLNKSISVAREIAEIDPYLKIVIFEQGINQENIDNFIHEDKKLDLIIDECDSLDIKILLRKKSKKSHIPVIMDTSDRGMVDIERFDIEPDRAILHGLINEAIDVNILKNYSYEEKVAMVLKILGGEKISDRLKFSFREIGKTINTWPQLASAVTIGGGVITDVCRRILLNKHKASGRFYVDIESII